MVDNPTKIYNDYVRANLPNSMSYDTGTDRYDINSHSFFKFKNSNWYFNYISKYGYSALSAYAVNNFEPALVFDFKGNYFRKSATASTFGASITHAASTNATMVDSDGLLKWRPHNLIRYSEDFTNSNWTKNLGASVVGNNAVAPDGTTTASTVTYSQTNSRIYILSISSYSIGDKVTLAFWVRSDTVTALPLGLDGRTNGANNALDGSVAVTNTWSLVEFEATVLGNDTGLYTIIGWSGQTSAQIGDVEIWHPHFYRSDLGGMVNNPDTNSSYVPTTNSNVYAPRRGHHIYNGSAWVNEGILHESEARTNLMTYSGDLTEMGWTSPRLTVGAVTAGSPFGTYQSITPTNHGTSFAANAFQIGKAITSGATYVGGSLVKYSAGSGWFALNLYDTGRTDERAYFDLQNGVVGSKEALIIDHGMIDYGDGWWLCWASSNTNSSSGGLSVAVTNGDNVITSSTSDTILIAGSQYEAGATPSSYIPTTTASATRAAETLTVPAANLPYDSTNMSIQMDGKMTYADTSNAFEVVPYWWRQGGTDFIHSQLSTVGGRTGAMQFYQRQSTSGQDFVSSGNNAYSPDVNVPFNLAARNGSTFLNGAHEGTLLTADTTPTILPDLSATDLNLGHIFMGTIGQFRMWSDDLGDVGITEAST